MNSALVSCRLGLGCLVVLLLHPHHELTPRPRYLLGQLWACEELLTDLPFTTHQPELKSAFSLTSLCTHFLKSLCLPYTKTLFKEAIKVCANKQLLQKIMYFFFNKWNTSGETLRSYNHFIMIDFFHESGEDRQMMLYTLLMMKYS